MFTATVVLLLSLISISSCAKLRIIESGTSSPRYGRKLRSTATICPSNVFSSSFTLECIPSNPSTATSATFSINGAFERAERVAPYILTGDMNGMSNKWIPTMDKTTVKCEFENGEMVQSMITFKCGRGGSGLPMVVPRDSDPEEEEEEDDESEGVTTEVPSSGDGPSACVKIPALSYESKMGAWTVEGSALEYRKGDSSTGTDDGNGEEVEYMFTAPVSGRYAVTVDMETEGGVDHNDIWLEFPYGGFSLERSDGKRDATGWTKAYHNKNGRAVEAFSVDFNPHAFSTKNSLMKGKKYVIKVGGRSTKVKVYSVVMFPCAGDGCLIGGYWNKGVSMCS